jgi:DUF917 family protein
MQLLSKIIAKGNDMQFSAYQRWLMQVLTGEQIRDVIYGAAFFAGGGGGSINDGETLLNLIPEASRKLTLNQLSEMPDSNTVVSVMVAALGSPEATEGETFKDESVASVQAMIKDAQKSGLQLNYLYSGEQGGANTMLALYVAIILGLPVLDLDCNGRAVPELNTGLFPIHDIPISPVVLASKEGDTIIIRPSDPLNSSLCEEIARDETDVCPPGLGFSAWRVNKAAHQRASAQGQISLSQSVGNILRNTAPSEILAALMKALGRRINIFAQGTIETINYTTETGFDYGTITIKETNSNDIFKIQFQNENLLLFDSNETALLTVPDMITLLDLDTCKPLSNTETRVGQNVAIIGIGAYSTWNDDGGYECWRQPLVSAGYYTLKPRVQIKYSNNEGGGKK